MKITKASLIFLALLALLLMTSDPASATVTRINYTIGEDSICQEYIESMLISGPNVHLYGGCIGSNHAYTEDGAELAMRSGYFEWYDCKVQIVAGKQILVGKTRLETYEGGVWEGSFSWTPNGKIHLVQFGQGMYKGMTAYEDYLSGYVKFNDN